MEQRPILSENEKLALRMAGDTTSRIMTLDGKTAQDVIEERNIKEFNKQVDNFADKYEKHSTNLETYADEVNAKAEDIEIMPISNYLLVKLFEENPFQRIVKDPTSGLIVDLGGLNPEIKNTDNGQLEEEEQFIKVGVVQEAGPDCKYCIAGDTVFATKPSLVPIPFYKQNLYYLNEMRVMAVVNEKLTERFDKIKNNIK
jgi:hypothetical protein